MRKLGSLVVGLGLVVAAMADAAPPRLAIGDPAPPLVVERWLRGAPVRRFGAAAVPR